MSGLRFCSVRALLCAALLACAAAGAGASPARAAFGITSADVYYGEADGSPARQAGSHPYEVTSDFRLSTFIDAEGKERPDGGLKDLQVDLPPGIVGIPEATPRCAGADFADVDKSID